MLDNLRAYDTYKVSRALLVLWLALLGTVPAAAQIPTVVSGQFKDVNGIAYSFARVSATLNGCAPAGCTIVVNGVPAQIGGQITATADVNGNYSLDLFCNSAGGGCGVISPSGTTWTITVNENGLAPPIGTGPQTCSTQQTIQTRSSPLTRPRRRKTRS